jgi:hypothetical protein
MDRIRVLCTAALAVCLLVAAPACTAPEDAAGKGRGDADDPAQALHLRKHSVVDTQGIGIEAFSLLVPVDWEVQGGIYWKLDNPGMPAVTHLTASNPDGVEAFEILPNQAMFWSNDPMLRSSFPIGSHYLGSEVRPVAEPLTALTDIVLPRFRIEAAELTVVSQTPLPELARAMGAGQPQEGVVTFADAGSIRITYTRNAVAMEERIIAVVEGFTYAIPTMQGMVQNTNWAVDYIFCFRAAKGKLDAHAGLFKAIVDSIRVNPQWYNRYQQTIGHLVQAKIQQINSVGELSRIISRTSDEISDSMMASYQERQAVYDRIGENFSEYIRGTEHYVDPIESREVELPGGYDRVWTSPGGGYILTDDPDYDPNIGSNRDWVEIERQ